MGAENGHKIKLLKLIELFRQETDEEHPMLASVVCEKLAQRGVPCDRRTLSRDIIVLNDNGYEVMSTMIGHEKAYYVADRSFDVPELKVLIDAVQAASFITEKKSAELISKIAALGGSNRASILQSNMVCFNTRKHSNEAIYYNVGFIEEAIEHQKKVVFLYHDIDENGERVYHRDGHHYIVEPIALVFNEDNYYLVSYSSRHGNTTNYRVDRMTDVKVVDDPITEVAISLREDVCEYTVIGCILKTYQQLLTDNNYLDFSGIQTEAFWLLMNHPEILADIQQRIKYLMVDEYQDTNYIQEQIAFSIAGSAQNICVVGDDDQGL